MARQISVQLISDLSGDLIPEDAGETVNFAIDGTAFEMDLTHEEAQTMRELFAEYSSKARRIGKATTGGRSKSPASTDEAKRIRAWAEENGIEVNARGRISTELREKWLAATRG